MVAKRKPKAKFDNNNNKKRINKPTMDIMK